MTLRSFTLFLLALASFASAQTQSFEVASIKPDLTGSDSRRAGTDPGGKFAAVNVSLKGLIAYAFGVRDFQVTGGPGWLDSDKYDIVAKADTTKEMSRDEVKPYVQALLADRFRLKFHRETREGTVYSLTVAKNGPKLKEHANGGASGIGTSTDAGTATISGTGVTMARLAEHLGGQAGRPVIDNTGLKGEYDFRLEWATEQNSASTLPSVFTALQEQLGLKLDSAKGPVEFIVVDSAERASAN
jgi:uncharacterized protein (TIGR03435 family)